MAASIAARVQPSSGPGHGRTVFTRFTSVPLHNRVKDPLSSSVTNCHMEQNKLPICAIYSDAQFTFSDVGLTHSHSHTDRFLLHCNFCVFSTDYISEMSELALLEHILNHHTICCNVCGHVFYSKSSYAEHLCEAHKDSKLTNVLNGAELLQIKDKEELTFSKLEEFMSGDVPKHKDLQIKKEINREYVTLDDSINKQNQNDVRTLNESRKNNSLENSFQSITSSNNSKIGSVEKDLDHRESNSQELEYCDKRYNKIEVLGDEKQNTRNLSHDSRNLKKTPNSQQRHFEMYSDKPLNFLEEPVAELKDNSNHKKFKTDVNLAGFTLGCSVNKDLDAEFSTQLVKFKCEENECEPADYCPHVKELLNTKTLESDQNKFQELSETVFIKQEIESDFQSENVEANDHELTDENKQKLIAVKMEPLEADIERNCEDTESARYHLQEENTKADHLQNSECIMDQMFFTGEVQVREKSMQIIPDVLNDDDKIQNSTKKYDLLRSLLKRTADGKPVSKNKMSTVSTAVESKAKVLKQKPQNCQIIRPSDLSLREILSLDTFQYRQNTDVINPDSKLSKCPKIGAFPKSTLTETISRYESKPFDKEFDVNIKQNVEINTVCEERDKTRITKTSNKFTDISVNSGKSTSKFMASDILKHLLAATPSLVLNRPNSIHKIESFPLDQQDSASDSNKSDSKLKNESSIGQQILAATSSSQSNIPHPVTELLGQQLLFGSTQSLHMDLSQQTPVVSELVSQRKPEPGKRQQTDSPLLKALRQDSGKQKMTNSPLLHALRQDSGKPQTTDSPLLNALKKDSCLQQNSCSPLLHALRKNSGMSQSKDSPLLNALRNSSNNQQTTNFTRRSQRTKHDKQDEVVDYDPELSGDSDCVVMPDEEEYVPYSRKRSVKSVNKHVYNDHKEKTKKKKHPDLKKCPKLGKEISKRTFQNMFTPSETVRSPNHTLTDVESVPLQSGSDKVELTCCMCPYASSKTKDMHIHLNHNHAPIGPLAKFTINNRTMLMYFCRGLNRLESCDFFSSDINKIHRHIIQCYHGHLDGEFRGQVLINCSPVFCAFNKLYGAVYQDLTTTTYFCLRCVYSSKNFQLLVTHAQLQHDLQGIGVLAVSNQVSQSHVRCLVCKGYVSFRSWWSHPCRKPNHKDLKLTKKLKVDDSGESIMKCGSGSIIQCSPVLAGQLLDQKTNSSGTNLLRNLLSEKL